MSERRKVLVTGGTAGLGRVIATGFARAGADVMICARTAAKCEAVAREIDGLGPGSCQGVAGDVTRLADIDMLVREAEARFGRLHVLVNNAGLTAPGPLESVTEELWDGVVDTSMKAVFFLTQRLAPLLRKGASADWQASVINIGSVAGGKVGPQPHYPYTPAKAGLNYLTKALAKGLAGDAIAVNAIALGVFPEDSHIMARYDAAAMDAIRQTIPVGRFGEGRDIVALTQFLASPAASYITGAVIPLDGGMHI